MLHLDLKRLHATVFLVIQRLIDGCVQPAQCEVIRNARIEGLCAIAVKPKVQLLQLSGAQPPDRLLNLLKCIQAHLRISLDSDYLHPAKITISRMR